MKQKSGTPQMNQEKVTLMKKNIRKVRKGEDEGANNKRGGGNSLQREEKWERLLTNHTKEWNGKREKGRERVPEGRNTLNRIAGRKENYER